MKQKHPINIWAELGLLFLFWILIISLWISAISNEIISHPVIWFIICVIISFSSAEHIKQKYEINNPHYVTIISILYLNSAYLYILFILLCNYINTNMLLIIILVAFGLVQFLILKPKKKDSKKFHLNLWLCL